MKSREKSFVISLTINEEATLFLVAEYREVVNVRELLIQLVNRCTPRAIKITKMILGPKKERLGKYGSVAQRLIDTAEHNAEQIKLLKFFRPQSLVVDRGL